MFHMLAVEGMGACVCKRRERRTLGKAVWFQKRRDGVTATSSSSHNEPYQLLPNTRQKQRQLAVVFRNKNTI